jgi:hypothetical protein
MVLRRTLPSSSTRTRVGITAGVVLALVFSLVGIPVFAIATDGAPSCAR